MKTLWCLVFVGMITTSQGQSFSEKITRELSFEKAGANSVMIYNINGNVTVEGYSGEKILIEVEKKINAKTEQRLALGKEEIQLGVLDRADTLILFVKGTCAPFGRLDRRERWQRGHGGWGYNWSNPDRGDECEKKYDYTMNFTVKVPVGSNVMASTVNRGDVEVKSVSGRVFVDNVNGSIRLSNLSNATRASTINGSVNVEFSGNPPGDSRFYSLNGDITANFRKGLAAQLAFRSFNGELYSSVDDITPLPVQLEKTDRGGEGTRYRVSGNRYKVRQGGPLLDFETFNGDVIIKEN